MLTAEQARRHRALCLDFDCEWLRGLSHERFAGALAAIETGDGVQGNRVLIKGTVIPTLIEAVKIEAARRLAQSDEPPPTNPEPKRRRAARS